MEDDKRTAECIIVADGDVVVRHAISEYLRDCGYMVIEAATSDEVVAAVEHSGLHPSAVLSDIRLSGSLNCFQLRAWMQAHRPALELVLAGNIESTAKAAAGLCEDGPHLHRPYDPQGVVDYIKRLLGRRK